MTIVAPPLERSAPEAIFIERYDRLLKWAFQLTKPDPELAKDLVHEAFVQFTLFRGDVVAINNIDNYLFGVLRNTHLSYLRRAAWLHEATPLPEPALAVDLPFTHDPRRLIKVKDELRAICRYACLRKETSVTGSVLLLRFFHGYFPSEIAKLLQSSRNIVDVQLKSARLEARACLAEAAPFGLPKRSPLRQTTDGKRQHPPADLLTELRREIFLTRRGDCPPLKQIYIRREIGLTRLSLSHLVSCPRCLDQANDILELPSLQSRSPFDVLGKETFSEIARLGAL